jgi:hypothetical protein
VIEYPGFRTEEIIRRHYSTSSHLSPFFPKTGKTRIGQNGLSIVCSHRALFVAAENSCGLEFFLLGKRAFLSIRGNLPPQFVLILLDVVFALRSEREGIRL